MRTTALYTGETLGRYGFGNDHPLGPERLAAFWREFRLRGHDVHTRIFEPRQATPDEISLFHTNDYIKRVITQSASGEGYLDCGDTPAFPGIFEAAATVVGTAIDATRAIMNGDIRRAFIPIAGLHHATRTEAAGFCVFNDCGVVIELLLGEYGLGRVAYVDIDAHHGDGVFYSFETDRRVCVVDIHEDGRFLYPGTGHRNETGQGDALGTKLNIPLPPGSGDELFGRVWEAAETYLRSAAPEFIILQCGADSIRGDPITHLELSVASHGLVAGRMAAIADEFANGRMLALGGGGYNHRNLAHAWNEVFEQMG
ncbi:acetoin utilization protein AcuC [Sedimenticola sp.]|uniref:acetoin utilization protein AcuC n=1 Tax=Sedimenticola sp. TaxID=1940285 RepID=UPI003D14E9D0